MITVGIGSGAITIGIVNIIGSTWVTVITASASYIAIAAIAAIGYSIPVCVCLVIKAWTNIITVAYTVLITIH
ncbi:hypothetical protein [Okeania hirsuta]|uniref:hypothetical protein n=1 Tax=Okeania hirsuta TaxID=1458930 RepID=UPI000F53F94B|nr:hypothetical protein [Okeania hirsuta]